MAGRHTLDILAAVVPLRVPTDSVEAHPAAPFTFVTDGVEAGIARAQAPAGKPVIAVAGGTIARQCLALGLLDEVAVDLVPVVMVEGSRPFFGVLSSQDVLLGNRRSASRATELLTWCFPCCGEPSVRNALPRLPRRWQPRRSTVRHHTTPTEAAPPQGRRRHPPRTMGKCR